jgi:phosphocarrier protein FPr
MLAATAGVDGGAGVLYVVKNYTEVTWPLGLHARPAAALVGAVRGLDADVRLRNLTRGGDAVPAAGLARVVALGAAQGHVLEVTANGRQAGEAVGVVLTLALTGFGDLDERDGPARGP